MPATEAQLARTRDPQVRREWRVSIGPPRPQLINLAFALNEPVTVPVIAALLISIGGTGTDTITVDSTATYATSGTVIIRPDSPDAGWYSYTGKTATEFTGCRHIHGRIDHIAGSVVSAWATIGHYPPLPGDTQRLDAPPLGREFIDGQFYDWDFTLSGLYFDRRLMKDDATVLIEERLFPEGWIDVGTAWRMVAVGYVRKWLVSVDKDFNNYWRGIVRSVKAYLDMFRFPATQYGRVELVSGASTTASDNLANAEDELAEFGGGLGTTEAENAVDDNNNTLYISQVAPSSIAETPGSSNGADPGVQIEEVFRGDAQSPNLWWILLRLAADSPRYNEEGQSLDDFAISNKQTVFRTSNVENWPKEITSGCAHYIRLKNLRVTSTNDIIIVTNNAPAFRARYNVGSTVQVVDCRFLDGFGNDQEPGRYFTLDVNDWLQLRYCRGLQTVRSMLVWNTHTGTPYWNGANDEDESGAEWNDPNTVTWTSPNTSLRRKPVSTNTRSTLDWDEEEEPNPADRRTDTDRVFWSVEVPEFTVNLAGDITNSVPADGGQLVLTDATWLDASGVIKIDGERIAYTSRNATTLFGIDRAHGGTTAASHTTAALVFQVDATLGDTRLPKVSSIEIRRWMRLVQVGNVLRNNVPERFEVYGSTLETPLFPGDDDWRLDWLDGSALISVTGNGSIHWEAAFDPPRRLRHVLIYCKKMTDSGRFKLNEVKLWRQQLDTAPNDEVGAGIVVRDVLQTVLAPGDITIDSGAFSGTNGELTTAEASVSEVLNDVLEENFCVCRCNRDGTVEVFRDPFHPWGRRVDIEVVFDAQMIRSPSSTDYPSRLGADQIVVELINTRSGDVYQGRYPPNANALNVRRVVLRRSVTSQDAANAAAARMYLTQPDISRTFTFMTFGAAEYLKVGDRILYPDYSDDERPDGQLINSLITALTHGVEDVEEITAQEWRAL